ncbi:unnamed protein product [Gongylonema pulchrum]|uniref:Cyclin_C domain-containing protein n=1 Tax=Gongylonema pulchrum TaxID=637853 RepID=A0A183D3I9_9BILA|nr:unnamed protein product [Gongylonema pulchrum]
MLEGDCVPAAVSDELIWETAELLGSLRLQQAAVAAAVFAYCATSCHYHRFEESIELPLLQSNISTLLSRTNAVRAEICTSFEGTVQQKAQPPAVDTPKKHQ